MMHPTTFNTAQVCAQLGVKHAVMSPGSRNAPLTVSFARHPDIKKWIVPDERSAGFIALGIAQETKSPVVLCCTSGSALLNYAPAVAEAYYREIPLIILSADRPPELIDQRDGQTIRQFESLKNHVKASIALPVINNDKDAEGYEDQLIKSIRQSNALPKGPIHINVPFKEPFYPTQDQALKYNTIETARLNDAKATNEAVRLPDVSSFRQVLILVGQNDCDTTLDNQLSQITEQVVVVRSPLNNLTSGIEHVDAFIYQQEELQPDLLITAGLSVLSKKLKTFLRNKLPAKHIHFDEAGIEVDTYSSKPELVKCSLSTALKKLHFPNADDQYLAKWLTLESKAKRAIDTYLNKAPFAETTAAYHILNAIPEDCVLHLSNSMPVRYADLFGVKKGINSYSNRGTSGIDGCTSTFVGTSLISDKINVLLTGDLAFLYDRNAFFHNYDLSNTRIIVLNNQGGGIFRLIDGPSKLPELESYFETRHDRTAEYICKEAGLAYHKVEDLEQLNRELNHFFQASGTGKIMEVFSTPEVNQKVYKELKERLHE